MKRRISDRCGGQLGETESPTFGRPCVEMSLDGIRLKTLYS